MQSISLECEIYMNYYYNNNLLTKKGLNATK